MKVFDRNIYFVQNYYFFILLLIPILGKLAIVIPNFPGAGLDPSWMLTLAVASSEHFIFGKDIIFTFGPLSSVGTGCWTLDGHILSASLSFTLALSLCFFVYKFFNKASYLVKFFLILFFFVNINAFPDFFFCLLPSIAALFLIESYSESSINKLYVCLFSFIVALLLLVKSSFGLEAFLDLLLLLGFYFLKKDKKSCLVSIVSFLLSFIFLYTASGQQISGIFYYPISVYYGVAGYNDAMSSNYDLSITLLTSALFLVFLILYLILINLKSFNFQGIFSVCVIALFVLVVFKHSYVRNDSGHHVDIYLLQCFLLIYILYKINKSTARNILLTLCVLSLLTIGSKGYWYYFNGIQVQNAYRTIINKIQSKERLFQEDENIKTYENGMEAIRKSTPLPVLSGTSDIYNFNQAVLLASENKWNPRPAFQSYQAVTPYLIKLNYKHLTKQNTAPDNVFFKLETIDQRFPSLDDGLSWVALLGMYKPTGWTEKKDYLILRRDSSDLKLSVKDVKKIKEEIGREIVNPYDTGLVFLKLNLRKSILGSLISVLYKTEPVWIKVKLQNGQEKSFRIIPSMTETGFLLSPLTESTMEFSNLYGAGYFSSSIPANRVKSVVITVEKEYQYTKSFEATFEQLEYPDKYKAMIRSKVGRVKFDFRDIIYDPSIKSCVDSFSYQFGNGKMSLVFSGWAFKNNVDINKSVFTLLLVDKKRREGFEVPLETVNRQDVSDFFHDGHNYALSGFSGSGLFDVSALNNETEYYLYLRMVINQSEYVLSLGKSLFLD